MPLISSDTYRPPSWLPNGHLQTIFPSVFRKVPEVNYVRERVDTPDGDFLNLDWAYAHGRPAEPPPSLVVLSHGFEGDSSRQYVRGMVRTMVRNGFDCLAWNFRSCGGEMNLRPRFYHSGATDDLDLVIRHALRKSYDRIYLVGFSLGGNLTLKYLGERGEKLLPSAIRKAVVFSVPMDLLACSRHLQRPSNILYQQRFLLTLKPKIEQKSRLFPQLIDSRKYHLIRSVYDFDDRYTAPLHGFRNAEDYYRQSSARYYLEGIPTPTLAISAINDPMIPVSSLPVETIARLPLVSLLLTRQGGHCGYRPMDPAENIYWSEQQALQFFSGN